MAVELVNHWPEFNFLFALKSTNPSSRYKYLKWTPSLAG
jgi:hypothetical protein